jgi:hypothetical protein
MRRQTPAPQRRFAMSEKQLTVNLKWGSSLMLAFFTHAIFSNVTRVCGALFHASINGLPGLPRARDRGRRPTATVISLLQRIAIRTQQAVGEWA